MVLGITLVIACSLIPSATSNYVIGPLSADLGATRDQTRLLRELPSIATLLVVFLVGAWGTKLGPRRVIGASAAVFTAGCALMAVAGAMPMVIVGTIMAGIGKQGIAVVAISLIASRLVSEDDRATGFAMVGLAGPVVFLVAPVAASVLLDHSSWRVVLACCLPFGVAALIASRVMLPADGPRIHGGEMWTPALAGFLLVGLVRWITTASNDGIAAPETLAWMAAGVIALTTLAIVLRRMKQPTLDLRIFARGGYWLLLIVVALMPFTNLWYYQTVGGERVFGLSAAQVSLLLVPSQLTGIAGVWVARWWLRRLGIRLSGTILLAGISGALFLTVLQSTSSPLIQPVLVMSLFALCSSGAGVVITNAIMNLASAGQEGNASSMRAATGAVGSAMGVVLSSAILLGAAQGTMERLSSTSGESWQTTVAVIQGLRDSDPTSDIAANTGVSQSAVAQADVAGQEALVSGYRVAGVAGGLVALISCIVFAVNPRVLPRRREEELLEDAASTADKP